MSNYHDKYLKYKKKYIDLKNDYEGGADQLYVFFWSSTNKPVDDIFNSISEKFTNYLNNENNNLNQPYFIDIDLSKSLNGFLNIFTYKIGDNKVEPFFKFSYGENENDGTSNKIIYKKELRFNNTSNKNEYNGKISTRSRRMQHLLPSFGKAINKYLDSSVILFNDKTNLIINRVYCEALKLQLDKIIALINTPDKLNPKERITRTKTLLEMVKMYQDLTTQDILDLQESSIGLYAGKNINGPSGTEGTVTKKVNSLSPEEKNTKIKERINDYYSKSIEIVDFGLEVPADFKFSNIDKTMFFRLKNGKFEVLNIFPNATTAPASAPTEENK
jgi:hypothetical protein